MLVQCHFCSRSNPADAQFCDSCLAQLNLAPCPHCDGVNEASTPVCHACKGELVQAIVERASGGSEQAETEPASSGIDTWPQSATRSTASGGFLGSSRETYVSTELAAASLVERLEGSIRHAATDAPAAYIVRGTRHSTEPAETRSEPAEGGLGSPPAANPIEFGRLGRDAVAPRPQFDELPPEHAKTEVERRTAVPAKIVMVPLRPAPELLRRTPSGLHLAPHCRGSGCRLRPRDRHPRL